MCAIMICLFWEGRSSLSTCLLGVNEWAWQLPTVPFSRLWAASTLCSLQPHHTWSNTVKRSVIIKDYCKVQYSMWYHIGQMPKGSPGQKSGNMCVYRECGAAVFWMSLSCYQLNFSWRGRESKNSVECLCKTWDSWGWVGWRLLGVRSLFKITSSLSLPSLF